jgi:hypothetical protein
MKIVISVFLENEKMSVYIVFRTYGSSQGNQREVLLAVCSTEEAALNFCQNHGLLTVDGVLHSRASAFLHTDKRLVIEKMAVI